MSLRTDIIKMLAYPPDSPDAQAIRRDADALSRERFSDKALLLGQIGVERHPCPGGCRFCTFSADYFKGDTQYIDVQAQTKRIVQFAGDGTIDALFLMTMHDFEADRLLELVQAVRPLIPQHVRVVLNVGDSPQDFWHQAKQSGVSGAYHVLRLREGQDTTLDPRDRRRTIEAIRSEGLDWYTCCEPIGQEHSNEELADAILQGNEFGCFQHAAMARVNFPGSPMPEEIGKQRLAQIVAVIALASAENPELASIAVHEPDALSLVSGANSVYAEAGANPRDVLPDTAIGRGHDAAAMQALLREANWS